MKRLDRLDLAAGAAALILVLAIGLIILGGDHAGIGIVSFAPGGEAHSTTPIHVVFSASMDTGSVEAHFRIDPPLEGRFSWNGAQMTFEPRSAWSAGTTYTVTFGAGAMSTSGRRLLQDVRYTFRVVAPKVVYLAPAVTGGESDVTNLWLVDPAVPFQARQLTFSKGGVDAFRPAPDGTQIAYVQAGARGTADLYLLDVNSGTTRRLTNCAASEARCQAPDWSPDGTRLVYERIELSAALADYDRNVPRAWLLSLRDLSTAPLLSDSQMLGGVPMWSPDGTQIAVFDRNLGAIAVYDIASGGRKLIPTVEGESGAFAFDSDGKRLVFPQLTTLQGQFSSALAMVDLGDPQGGITVLSGPDVSVIEDKLPAWKPNSDQVAFTRRSLDGSGPLAAQVYTVDIKTGESKPLILNEQYFDGAISWSPGGDQLLMQRLRTAEANPQPGIWVYDAASGQTWQIARNGYLPRWLP